MSGTWQWPPWMIFSYFTRQSCSLAKNAWASLTPPAVQLWGPNAHQPCLQKQPVWGIYGDPGSLPGENREKSWSSVQGRHVCSKYRMRLKHSQATWHDMVPFEVVIICILQFHEASGQIASEWKFDFRGAGVEPAGRLCYPKPLAPLSLFIGLCSYSCKITALRKPQKVLEEHEHLQHEKHMCSKVGWNGKRSKEM